MPFLGAIEQGEVTVRMTEERSAGTARSSAWRIFLGRIAALTQRERRSMSTMIGPAIAAGCARHETVGEDLAPSPVQQVERLFEAVPALHRKTRVSQTAQRVRSVRQSVRAWAAQMPDLAGGRMNWHRNSSAAEEGEGGQPVGQAQPHIGFSSRLPDAGVDVAPSVVDHRAGHAPCCAERVIAQPFKTVNSDHASSTPSGFS